MAYRDGWRRPPGLAFLVLYMLWMCLFGTAGHATQAASPNQDPVSCHQLWQRGALQDTAICWKKVLEWAERDQESVLHRDATLQLAKVYQALGQDHKAVAHLNRALAFARAAEPSRPVHVANVLASLGHAHIVAGPKETAEAYLREALRLAITHDTLGLIVAVQNDLGNLFASQGEYHDALEAYRDSAVQAETAGQAMGASRALANTAKVALQLKQFAMSAEALDNAWHWGQKVPSSHDTALTWISIGETAYRLHRHLPALSSELLSLAYTTLTQAVEAAQDLGDVRAESYALGYLGRLYEAEDRDQEALQLTRRAVFAAQKAYAPEALYKWQWQVGRLLAGQGDTDAAIISYALAVETLQSIRSELPRRYGKPETTFRSSVGQVYFELVDLLLKRAATFPESEPRYASDLQQTRETIERLKAEELQDYFQDECVQAAEHRRTSLHTISQTAIVVYPISLPDRLELLVNLPTGLKRFAVPVPSTIFEQTVKRFRQKLQGHARRYLRDAQDLYDWLIRPFEPALRHLSTDTIVFVPDGNLRTIPMAALHDGKQFLIEKYAIAITPGLDLTEPRPMTRQSTQLLAGGLTQATQGYRALPYVADELRSILNLYRGTLLIDDDFRLEKLADETQRKRFGIVHIASHGQFVSSAGDSFILTANAKLSLDHLRDFVGRFRYHKEPLELLTLSACETALGDDRAALGLAGIAIKAGARSALATLWRVNDKAASQLVETFYRQLLVPMTSRADALQYAQRSLLKDKTSHPFFWAPFLLINTWL